MAKRARLENRAGQGAIIAQVAAEFLLGEELPTGGAPTLLVDDDTEVLAEAIREAGGSVSRWDRRAYGGRAARVWPSQKPAAAAMVRLPKDWASFELSLNAVAGRLEPGARLWVYGANAEGIRSAPRRMSARYFGEVETRLLKRRSRVLECVRNEATEGLAVGIDSFREENTLSLPALASPLEVKLVSYPGAFARGALDGGTAALLKGATGIKPRRRVLDFCCGIGVVGVWAKARWPEAELTLLDVDAVSLHAAAENLPGARTVLSDGFRGLGPGERYDAILSNPPIHRGAEEDMTLLHELVQQAPGHLTASGMLVVVCQRSVGLGALLEAHFKQTQLLAETTSFQVWCGSSPVRAQGGPRGRERR